MTPALSGRLQLRLLLFAVVAIPVSFAVSYFAQVNIGLMLIMALIGLAVGLFCDCLYQAGQHIRWDKDWPPILFFIGAVIEFAIIVAAARFLVMPDDFSIKIVGAHFWTIWLGSMILIFHIIHIFKPSYRYSGGKILKRSDVYSDL